MCDYNDLLLPHMGYVPGLLAIQYQAPKTECCELIKCFELSFQAPTTQIIVHMPSPSPSYLQHAVCQRYLKAKHPI